MWPDALLAAALVALFLPLLPGLQKWEGAGAHTHTLSLALLLLGTACQTRKPASSKILVAPALCQQVVWVFVCASRWACLQNVPGANVSLDGIAGVLRFGASPGRFFGSAVILTES